jgi:acetyltransferase-like isoleucine patch superfamily enzyme
MKYSFPMVIPVVYDRILQKIYSLYNKFRTFLLVWFWGIKHGKKLLFQGRTIIRTRKKNEIVLGDCVVFNAALTTNLVGLINPTILDTRFGGHIEIGNRTGASSVVISSKTFVKIGSRCQIGGNVRIFDHDFHSLDAAIRCTSEDRNNIRSSEIEIGDDCFIGTNSILLKGTRIGARSIVAAGSVVFGLKVPPDSLVKGNPAQIVRR